LQNPRIDESTDQAASTPTCSTCRACCCRLEVLVIGDPHVPDEMTTVNDWGGTVMRRMEDGWCVALDRDTMRCSIYARRPQICRDFEMGGEDCRETITGITARIG